MRIPVIAFLPRQEPLIESAIAERVRTPRGLPEGVRTPRDFEPDQTFPAVPVGGGRSELETTESVAPERSENFAIRGTVEADSLEAVPAEADGVPLFADPEIAPFLTCGPTPVGSAADVAQKLNVAALQQAGLDGDGVAVAVLDTGIDLQHLSGQLGRMPRIDAGNSWTPQGVTGSPFQRPKGHGTMCAYDVLLAAPNATLLDLPILLARPPGGSVAGSVLSTALLGFSHLLAFWAVGFAPSGGPRYKALVVNNSWGIYHPSWDFPPGHPGRYSDNRNHPSHCLA